MRLPRMTTWKWMIVIALLAVAFAAGLGLARRRFRRIDSLVGLQISLSRRIADDFKGQERESLEAAARCAKLAEQEDHEAAKWPEGSDDRIYHDGIASRWNQAANHHRRLSNQFAQEARNNEVAADGLEASRPRSVLGLIFLERLGRRSRIWVDSLETKPDLSLEVRKTVSAEYTELQAKNGRNAPFPTVAGPRASAIEAAAIWKAEEFLKMQEPGLDLRGHQASAVQVSPTEPYIWKVTFTDPKTRRVRSSRGSFSPSTVLDYVAKHP